MHAMLNSSIEAKQIQIQIQTRQIHRVEVEIIVFAPNQHQKAAQMMGDPLSLVPPISTMTQNMKACW